MENLDGSEAATARRNPAIIPASHSFIKSGHLYIFCKFVLPLAAQGLLCC